MGHQVPWPRHTVSSVPNCPLLLGLDKLEPRGCGRGAEAESRLPFPKHYEHGFPSIAGAAPRSRGRSASSVPRGAGPGGGGEHRWRLPGFGRTGWWGNPPGLREWVGGDAPRQGGPEERMGCVARSTLGTLHVPAPHCLVGDWAPTPGTLWAAGLERDLERVRPAGGTLQVCRQGRGLAPEPRAQGEAEASRDGARENRSSRQSVGRGPPGGCRPPPSEAKLGCACGVLGILTHSPMSGEATRGGCPDDRHRRRAGAVPGRLLGARESSERCSTLPVTRAA